MIPDSGLIMNAALKILPCDFHGVPISRDTLNLLDTACSSIRD
jgi:hypothetical protein